MPVDDLASALRLEPVGNGRYRGQNVALGERGVVFGGQLLAQIAVAAARTHPDKRLESVQALFGRPVSVDDITEIEVDTLHAGRSLVSASVTLRQHGSDCARGLVLLTAVEPDLIRFGLPAPQVGLPADATIRADLLPDREVRIVGGIDIDTTEPNGPPELDLWLSLRGDHDATVRAGLLVHATAGFLIGATMRPHPGIGQSIAHSEISTGIVSHAVFLHDEVPEAGWLLIHQENVSAAHGRAHGRGSVFREEGSVIASFHQESIIRQFPSGVSTRGKEATIL